MKEKKNNSNLSEFRQLTEISMDYFVRIINVAHAKKHIGGLIKILQDASNSAPGTVLLIPTAVVHKIEPSLARLDFCSTSKSAGSLIITGATVSQSGQVYIIYMVTGEPNCNVELVSVKALALAKTHTLTGVSSTLPPSPDDGTDAGRSGDYTGQAGSGGTTSAVNWPPQTVVTITVTYKVKESLVPCRECTNVGTFTTPSYTFTVPE